MQFGRSGLRWLAGACLATWLGASGAHAPLDDWVLEPAQQHGIAEPALNALRQHLVAAEPSIRALITLRQGRPVFEYYRAGLDARTQHPTHSITKSVVSTLVGVAPPEATWPAPTRRCLTCSPKRRHPARRRRSPACS